MLHQISRVRVRDHEEARGLRGFGPVKPLGSDVEVELEDVSTAQSSPAATKCWGAEHRSSSRHMPDGMALEPKFYSWLTANFMDVVRLLQQSLMMMTLMTILLVDNVNISLFHDSPINFSQRIFDPSTSGAPGTSCHTQPTEYHHDLMAKQIVYHLFKLRNLYGTDRPRKTHL